MVVLGHLNQDLYQVHKMSSVNYEIELMAKSPFVRTLALAVIRNILSQKISYDEKQVIDAELVPRLSKQVALATLKEGKTDNEFKMSDSIVPQVPQPLQKPLPLSQNPIPRHQRPILINQRKRPIQMAPSMINIQGSGQAGLVQGDYGKITLLLNDPSVSSIECPGPDTPIVVIRAGQRQFTRISLNQEELRNLFEKISEQARIPLMDGVFRAAVENFLINGVISEMIGSRFVIKKQTPYALLEGR